MECGKLPKCPGSNGKVERIDSLGVFVEDTVVKGVDDDNEESKACLGTGYDPYI